MITKGLKEFIALLEKNNELIRITEEISPHLEITEITDRVSKGKGKALLFEQVKGHTTPVLMNAFGSMKRVAWALGVNEVDEIGKLFENLMESKMPAGWLERLKL